MSDKTEKRPSPMRMLRAWLFRERAARGPAALELDVAERQINREVQAVSAAAVSAGNIERSLDGAKKLLADSLADGVVDHDEARRLARRLVGTSLAAHHHTLHLEGLR